MSLKDGMLVKLNRKLRNLMGAMTSKRPRKDVEEIVLGKQIFEDCNHKLLCFEKYTQCLREEIELLRQSISAKEAKVQELQIENMMFKEAKDVFINERCSKNQEVPEFCKEMSFEKNGETINCDTDINKLLQEVYSLRIVLALTQDEIKTLRVALDASKLKEEELGTAETKVRLLNSRCEDLQEQVRRKCETERYLLNEISELKNMVIVEDTSRSKSSHSFKRKSYPKIKRVIKKPGAIAYMLDLEENNE